MCFFKSELQKECKVCLFKAALRLKTVVVWWDGVGGWWVVVRKMYGTHLLHTKIFNVCQILLFLPQNYLYSYCVSPLAKGVGGEGEGEGGREVGVVIALNITAK